MSDRELAARLRQRQKGAFDELFRRYHGRVWAFVWRLAGDRREAEDLFQETWLAAARHAHRVEQDSEFVPWLLTIARNKHRNARRFRLFETRKRAALTLEPQRVPMGTDEAADANLRLHAVEEAFAMLSHVSREVLLVCLVEGLDAPRAARVLGLREAAVRKRLSRARAELASLLAAPDPACIKTHGERHETVR